MLLFLLLHNMFFLMSLILQLITQSAVPAGKADKKSAPATAGVNTSSSKTAQTPTHMHSAPSPTNPHSVSIPELSHFTAHKMFINIKKTKALSFIC